MSLLPYDLHKCHEFQTSWPTWKSDSCLEICWSWIPSEPCLNNLERLRFVICLYKKIFCSIDQGIIRLFFVEYIERFVSLWQSGKIKMNKVIHKGFRSCRFVSTIVKHPIYYWLLLIWNLLNFDWATHIFLKCIWAPHPLYHVTFCHLTFLSGAPCPLNTQ